ncbi:MAG: hypothetical protein QM733_22550 [Ilumatobacteraceae bacterium]
MRGTASRRRALRTAALAASMLAAIAPAAGASAPPSTGDPPATIVATEASPGTSAAPAAAGDGLVWSMQPAGTGNSAGRAFLVHDVDPGTRFTDAIWIDNFGVSPLTLDVYAADGFTTDGGGLDVRTASEPATDVGLWARPEVSVVTIDPGVRVEIPVHFDVPLTATPGDHVGGIVAASVSRQVQDGGRAVDIESRVGVRVYLRVDGELHPQLTVDDVRTDWSSGLSPTGTMTLSYTVRNTGNVRLGAEQHLAVTGPFAWSMRRPELADLTELLPGAEVRQQVVVSGLPAALRAWVGLTLLPVDTSGRLPAAAPKVAVSTTVWAVPWPLVIVLLLIALGLVEWRRRVAVRKRKAAASGAPAAVPAAARDEDAAALVPAVTESSETGQESRP